MDKRIFKQSAPLILSILVFLNLSNALGASACYQVFDFPAASEIEVDLEGRLNVYFNNRHTEPKNDGTVFMLDPARGWEKGEVVKIDHPQGSGSSRDGKQFSKSCEIAAMRADAEINLSKEEFVKYRPRRKHVLADPEFNLDQSVTSCHDTPASTLLGLGFYDGENSHGYGGIAKLDKASGKLEVARNEFFAEDSINSIIEYNEQIFVGTTGFYECYGLPPTSGLLLYNWDKEQVSYVVNNEICGGVIHDMAVWNDELWVATDMGLSKGTAPDDKAQSSTMWRYNWKNYVPSDNPDEVIREVSCNDLYHELLLDMPPSSSQFDASIYFLIKGISRKYSLENFFVEFVEKHKNDLKSLEIKNSKNQ